MPEMTWRCGNMERTTTGRATMIEAAASRENWVASRTCRQAGGKVIVA
jgi:hypothetical protein